MIALDAPWNPARMAPVRSPWALDCLRDVMTRAHQQSPRDADECAGDPARLVAIRAKRKAPTVEVVYRVRSDAGHDAALRALLEESDTTGDASAWTLDAKALAFAAAAALRAFAIDFRSVTPPVTAERLVVTSKCLSPTGT